jgi:hypothetical protein
MAVVTQRGERCWLGYPTTAVVEEEAEEAEEAEEQEDEWCYKTNVRLLEHEKHDLPELFSLEVNSEGLLILQKKSKVRCGRWPEPVDHLARRGGSLCSTGGGCFVRALLRLVATFY